MSNFKKLSARVDKLDGFVHGDGFWSWNHKKYFWIARDSPWFCDVGTGNRFFDNEKDMIRALEQVEAGTNPGLLGDENA